MVQSHGSFERKERGGRRKGEMGGGRERAIFSGSLVPFLQRTVVIPHSYSFVFLF